MKTWYAAHIVMVVELSRAKQETFPAFENIVLVAADSSDEAYAKAEKYGQAEASVVDDSFHWGKHRARLSFAGVRKLTECAFSDDEPCDLGEATYIDLEFSSRDAVDNYLAGHDQRVTIRDPFPEPPRSSVIAEVEPKRSPKRKGA